MITAPENVPYGFYSRPERRVWRPTQKLRDAVNAARALRLIKASPWRWELYSNTVNGGTPGARLYSNTVKTRPVWSSQSRAVCLACQAWLLAAGQIIVNPLPADDCIRIQCGGYCMGTAGELFARLPFLAPWLPAERRDQDVTFCFFEFQGTAFDVWEGLTDYGILADGQEAGAEHEPLIARLIEIGEFVRRLTGGTRKIMIRGETDVDKIAAARAYAEAAGWPEWCRERLAERHRELHAPAIPLPDRQLYSNTVTGGDPGARLYSNTVNGACLIADANAPRWIGDARWVHDRRDAIRFAAEADARRYLADHPELTLDCTMNLCAPGA